MADITWTNTRVKIGELKPWADNPRMSTKAQAQRLLKSFKQYGQVITVAIDPDHNVLDGHQRLSALLTVHGEEYEIDARQSNRALTLEERQGLVAALHLGAFGSWDWEKLSGWDVDLLGEWGADMDTKKIWDNDANNLKEMILANEEIEFTEYDESIADGISVCTCPHCGNEHAKKD